MISWAYADLIDSLSMLYVRFYRAYYWSLAGFCESSLGHVERLNVESMQWEDMN